MDIAEQLRFVFSQIRTIRLQKGISQLELSLRAGLSQSFLASLEKGKKTPSVATMFKIANALGVNPKDFFPENAGLSTREQYKDAIIQMVRAL